MKIKLVRSNLQSSQIFEPLKLIGKSVQLAAITEQVLAGNTITSISVSAIGYDMKSGDRININDQLLTLSADASAGATSLSVNSVFLDYTLGLYDSIDLDKNNLFVQYQRKTEGQVAGFDIDADGIAKGGVEITGWLDSDTMTGATSNNVPTAESVKSYVDSQINKPNFSSLTCSGTSLSSATDGDASAVVCKYDTETTISDVNTIIIYGAGGVAGATGGEYSFSVTPEESLIKTAFEFTWNVGFNTSVVNNRILMGVKLQQGSVSGGAVVWADVDPTISFAYNRGAGAIRQASTSNGMLVIIEAGQPIQYFRLLFWKVAASNASMKGITEINATNFRIKQIN